MAGSKVNTILKDILKEIKPEITNVQEIDEFLAKINLGIKRNKLSARAVIGGSFAKDTCLKEDHDVDIFVMFNLKHRKEDLSKHTEKILKGLKAERVHGSRDYFKFDNEFNFEIVPVLDIKKPEDAENVTDFSPEHVKWVKKNVKEFKDDIRLAKKFCKANKVYGAESYIRGFSGHVLDIIVIYYKGFIPMLKAAAKWKKKQVIDFYNVHKGKALFDLNKSKTQSSMIVIDPVQPDRNASAAIIDEKYELFISAAKSFLKKPSKKFFEEKTIDLLGLKKKNAVIVEAESVKGKQDVSGAKLMKAFEFLKKGFSDFGIKDSGWEWDKKKKAIFWIIPLKQKLPEKMEWTGPPLIIAKSVKDFKKKYKKTFVKKGRMYAEVKRKHVVPSSLVKELIKNKYFKERAKKAK